MHTLPVHWYTLRKLPVYLYALNCTLLSVGCISSTARRSYYNEMSIICGHRVLKNVNIA